MSFVLMKIVDHVIIQNMIEVLKRWIYDTLVEFLIMRFCGGFWVLGNFLMKIGESREFRKIQKHHKPTQNPTTHSSIKKSTFRFFAYYTA
jgi:hypothetical protein